MSQWEYSFRWLVAAILAAIGLWLLLRGLRRLLLANPERRWQSVEGTIIESFVEEDDSGDSTTYRAKVQYTYLVGGINFVGDCIAPLTSFGARWSARRERARYMIGQKVDVYVNPRNPGDSVLEPGQQILRAAGLSVAGAVLCAWAYHVIMGSQTPD